MQKKVIHTLIGRVLSGEGSSLEQRQVNEWINESPENGDTFRMMEEAWEESRFKFSYPRQNDVFNKISQHIHSDLIEREERPPTGNRHIKWYRYTAIFALLISFTAFLLWFTRQNATSPENQSVALITKSIPIGSKLKFYLPDGSIVWLNADSKLIYPENFDGNQRIVQLEGEAFFNVVRDTLRPFIVQTGFLSTRVLGTSFNINALSHNNDIKVAVVSGLVKVEEMNAENAMALLKPSQMAVYSKATKSLRTQPCDIESITSWKDGIIVFKDANINQVVTELERWYGVQFILDSDLETGHSITVTYDNQTLEYVLDGLNYMSSIKYRKEDKKVYLFNN